MVTFIQNQEETQQKNLRIAFGNATKNAYFLQVQWFTLSDRMNANYP